MTMASSTTTAAATARPAITQKKFVTVQTTLPAPPYPLVSERTPIKTKRLLIRPHRASDLDALYAMRRQQAVMQYTIKGTVDVDRAESEAWLAQKLAPHGDLTYDFAIADLETDELLGTGGCHLRAGEMGWPELGYLFRTEAHGKGYATEFVNGYLEAYWALPRAQTDVVVDAETVRVAAGADGGAAECLLAITVAENAASQNVLRKTGWTLVKAFEEPEREESPEAGVVELWAWIKTRP